MPMMPNIRNLFMSNETEAERLFVAKQVARMVANAECESGGGQVKEHFATTLADEVDAQSIELARLREELEAARKENQELKEFVSRLISVQHKWTPSMQARGIKAYRVAESVFDDAKRLIASERR